MASVLCLIFALVCFILAALNVAVNKVPMLPVGLCFVVAAALIGNCGVCWPWRRGA